MKLSEMYIRDPFILPFGGKYYIFGTPGEYAWNGSDGFYCSMSEDLLNWSKLKKCFQPPEGFWANENFWAPEVHYFNGRFFMFASFYAKDHMRSVQILVSDNPDGPYEVWSCPITPNDWMCLDGTFYVENGKPYMVFCHEWLQTHDGEMCLLELSDDLKESIGKPKVLFKASESGWSSDKKIDGFITDGPFIYKTSENKLLMTWSSFDVDGYAVGVAYSDDGKISGKWNHCKKILSKKNGGHGMISRSFTGELFFVMHYPNDPFGTERPCIVPIKETHEDPYLQFV